MLLFQLKSISMCGCPYELQSTGSVPSLNECSIYAQTRVFHLSLSFFYLRRFSFWCCNQVVGCFFFISVFATNRIFFYNLYPASCGASSRLITGLTCQLDCMGQSISRLFPFPFAWTKKRPLNFRHLFGVMQKSLIRIFMSQRLGLFIIQHERHQKGTGCAEVYANAYPLYVALT